VDDILTSIERLAQSLEGERMPENKTLNEARQIAEKLQMFMKERRLKSADVCRAIGEKDSKFSQFLTGKYTAKKGLEELINKSVNFMESQLRSEKKGKNVGYVETTVARRIAGLIAHTEALTDNEGRIGIVIGDGGHGKSACLREYARANLNTVNIELDDTMTPTTMFRAIAGALKIDSSGSLANVASRLVESLVNRYIVIMLDEASSLSVKMLNQLRQIIVVKARCPLILSGNQDLLKTVMQPATRRGFESLDQFTSRLSYILNLDESANSKSGGLYTIEDIRKLYQYGGIRLTGRAIDTLRKICMTERTGRLRTCFNIITALHTAPDILKQGSIDSSDIFDAIEQLGLPVRVWLPLSTRQVEDEEEPQQQQTKAS